MEELNALQALVPIVDDEGKPTPQFQQLWQIMMEHMLSAEERLDLGGL